MNKTRTTADLVTELRETANGADAAALVVGFEKKTKFVWAHDQDPLAALNAHIQAGGEPVGLAVRRDQHLEVTPLREYQGTEWVRQYLSSLLASFAQEARHAGIKVGEVVSNYDPVGDAIFDRFKGTTAMTADEEAGWRAVFRRAATAVALESETPNDAESVSDEVLFRMVKDGTLVADRVNGERVYRLGKRS